MKICFSSYHKYPGSLHGVAAHSVHDNLVKGLAEIGHDVYYQLKEKPHGLLPEGVIYTPDRIKDADIWHINDGPLEAVPSEVNFPWVKIIHSDIRINGFDLDICQDNWVYVSKTLAELYGSNKFVHNGINPEDFVYSETKEEYLFFIVGGVERAHMKGIDIALSIAEESGIELKIAGSSNNPDALQKFKNYCNKPNVSFIGPVYGKQKAELFAGAKALLFPSHYNEACPLVISEALMSGTPVISSANGACPELLNNDIGFICNNKSDYLNSLNHLNSISSINCRNYALENFHYLKMAESYANLYKHELEYMY